MKRMMGFDQEVEKVWPHEPLDLGLNINRVDVGEGSELETQVSQASHQEHPFTDIHLFHMLQDVVFIFLSSSP